jgi:hypothetical protein
MWLKLFSDCSALPSVGKPQPKESEYLPQSNSCTNRYNTTDEIYFHKKSQRHRSRNQKGRKTFTAEARSSQRPEYASKILHLCALSVFAVLFPDASFIRDAKHALSPSKGPQRRIIFIIRTWLCLRLGGRNISRIEKFAQGRENFQAL